MRVIVWVLLGVPAFWIAGGILACKLDKWMTPEIFSNMNFGEKVVMYIGSVILGPIGLWIMIEEVLKEVLKRKPWRFYNKEEK